MHIRELPKVLFEEISKKYGQGEEKDLVYDGFRYSSFRELDPVKTGYRGAIGFGQDGNHAFFVLWSGVPEKGEGRSVGFPKPIVRTVAGPQYAGIWAFGNGSRMKETAYAEIDFPGTVHLEYPSTPLIGEILLRAHTLTKEAEKSEYWESERHPDRDYTRPDR